MNRCLSAQFDNQQKVIQMQHEAGELESRQFDMNDLLKYQLLDQRPVPTVNDDGPRRSVHTLMRPLDIREFGSRTQLAPYTPDIFIGDRTPDCRGTENIPNQRKIAEMTYQKSRWIQQNLYPDAGLQVVSEQVPHLKLVQYRQKADKLKKDYLKIFSDEKVGGPNLKFIQKKTKGSLLVANSRQDQDLSDGLKTNTKIRSVKNYNEIKSEDGLEIGTRTEPDHLQLVGDYKTVVRSNPTYDPAARALGVTEQFKATRDLNRQQLANPDHKVFIQKYKHMQLTARDPNATQQDRDMSRTQFMEALKTRVKAPTKQVQVDYREQAQDRDTQALDFLEHLMTGNRTRKLTIDKTNPLFNGLDGEQLDHFKQNYQNLEEQDQKLVKTAIRKYARPGTDSTIRLAIAEQITELAVKGQIGRRHLQVLTDQHASEQEINLALADIQERLTTAYRNTMPPKQAQSRINQLILELDEMRHQSSFKHSQNSKLLGNASKTQRNRMNYAQPTHQHFTDQTNTLKLANKTMNLSELQALHSAARNNGSQQQIQTAHESTSFRVNTASRNPFAAKNLRHVAQQRDSRMDEAIIGK